MERGSGNIGEFILYAIAIFVMCMIALAVMLPIQLKFGAEKARTVIFITIGGMMILMMFIGYLVERFSDALYAVVLVLETVGTVGIAIGGVLLTVIALVVSIVISQRIMEKKQF